MLSYCSHGSHFFKEISVSMRYYCINNLCCLRVHVYHCTERTYNGLTLRVQSKILLEKKKKRFKSSWCDFAIPKCTAAKKAHPELVALGSVPVGAVVLAPRAACTLQPLFVIARQLFLPLGFKVSLALDSLLNTRSHISSWAACCGQVYPATLTPVGAEEAV